jgi:OmpA-OmpF porin, OOP family
MTVLSRKSKITCLFVTCAMILPGSVSAQQAQDDPNIIVDGQQMPEADPFATGTPVKGPEIKGLISARSGDRLQVTAADGSKTIVAINDTTKIRSSKGLFSRKTLAGNALLNGLPVTVKTMQYGNDLLASHINVRGGDLKTANMIQTGTAQGFAEQTAATAALRGRMGDIDEYNIKGTTNVNFDTGKWNLTDQGKADLCAASQQAGGMKNAFLLVVGYTDSVGDEDFNQQLSEKRASRVVNHLQQACGWKPYRMLTPTGMSESDPMADNSTPEGKAQNRRVAVNILVSKGLDGM